MTDRPTLAERSALPPILWPEDLAAVLGLPSPRAAKEFVMTHGIPHVRLGRRVFVLAETLVAFLRDREERGLTKEEARAKADATIRTLAPTAGERRRGRKPPQPGRE